MSEGKNPETPNTMKTLTTANHIASLATESNKSRWAEETDKFLFAEALLFSIPETYDLVTPQTVAQLEDLLILNRWESAAYASLLRLGDNHEDALHGVEMLRDPEADSLYRLAYES